MSDVVDLGNNVYQMDVYGEGRPGRTSSYLIRGSKMAIFETGAANCHEHLMKGLAELDAHLSEIDYVIVSHVHLDHAGGAGTLIKKLPNARVVVHPEGAKFLMDAPRLEKGVRSVYDVPNFYEIFGQTESVSKELIYTPADEEEIDLGGGRVIKIYHTPGHARHHIIADDPSSKGLFCGDALGTVYYPLSSIIGHDFIFYATPPHDYDLDEGIASCEKIGKLAPEKLYFSHFGVIIDVEDILRRTPVFLRKLTGGAGEVMARGGTLKEVEEVYWKCIADQLAEFSNLNCRDYIPEIDIWVCSQGLVKYHSRKDKSET